MDDFRNNWQFRLTGFIVVRQKTCWRLQRGHSPRSSREPADPVGRTIKLISSFSNPLVTSLLRFILFFSTMALGNADKSYYLKRQAMRKRQQATCCANIWTQSYGKKGKHCKVNSKIAHDLTSQCKKKTFWKLSFKGGPSWLLLWTRFWIYHRSSSGRDEKVAKFLDFDGLSCFLYWQNSFLHLF